MLQSFHDHIKGWIASVIIIVISFAFIFWGIQYYFQFTGAEGKTLVKVDGEKITERQFNQAFQRLQQYYFQKTGRHISEQNNAFKTFTLQSLILDHIELYSAKRLGFNVNRAQLDQAIMALPIFQENGKFSPLRFKRFASGNYLNSEFMTQLKNALIVQQVRNGITNSAFVLPNEVKSNYELLNQRRDFRYLIIPSSLFYGKTKITPKIMLDYYRKHPQAFEVPEKVSISYLLLSSQTLHHQVKVSDSEMKQLYTSSGEKRPFGEVKQQIKKWLIEQKVTSLLTQKSNQLSNLTYAYPTTLIQAARELNLKIQTTPLFTRYGTKEGITANPEVVAAAFSDDVLQDGNNSDVIRLKDRSLVVLRIKKHQAAHLLPFKIASIRIKSLLQKRLAETKASFLARKIRELLQNGKFPYEVAKYHLKWHVKNNISQSDNSVPKIILMSAFSNTLSSPVSIESLKNGDGVVLQLLAIRLANFKDGADKYKILQKTLSDYFGKLDYQLYIKNAQKQSRVTFYS